MPRLPNGEEPAPERNENLVRLGAPELVGRKPDRTFLDVMGSAVLMAVIVRILNTKGLGSAKESISDMVEDCGVGHVELTQHVVDALRDLPITPELMRSEFPNFHVYDKEG